MMRLLLPLALIASPVAAQDSIATRLDKARAEINTTENAADRAVAACQRGDTAKCGAEARTAANAASRALYAVDKARELATPTEPPHHVPPPTGDVLAPAPDLDFGFGLEKGTVPSWNTGIIPGPYEPDAGAFRFVCAGDGPLSYDDPIVYRGQPGASHLHDVFGNLAFDANTTRETLAANAATNCNATPFSHNRSSYWMPALLHDSGQVIRPDLTLVYYKRKRSISPACTPGAREFVGICSPLPNGIRFVFGWDMKNQTVQPPPGSAQWACTGVPGHFPDLPALWAAGCKAGDTLIAMTLAPNCWDGKRLDSADHRSHVAYVTYADGTGIGRCPASHPFLIPQEEAKSQFTVTADMVNRIRLSSDAMNPGGKPGASLHGDYWEAWSKVAKDAWTEHCIERGLNCSGGDLGNGRQLVGAGMPSYGWTNPNPRVAVPAR